MLWGGRRLELARSGDWCRPESGHPDSGYFEASVDDHTASYPHNQPAVKHTYTQSIHTTVDSLKGIADKWTIVYRISYCTLSVGLDLWSLAESLYLYFHNAYTLSSTKNGQIYDVLFFNVDMLRRKKISEVTLNTCMITWAISSAAEVDSHGIQNTRCINMKYIQQHNHTLM